MISPKRTYSCTLYKYTCIYYKYTKSDVSRQQKQNTCVIFGYFWELLVTVKNLTCGLCSLLLQNAR